MDREAIKSVIEKQKTISSLALGKGLGGPDTRVDEVVAENARDTIAALEKLIEIPMHPDPEINTEVNADIKAAQEADAAAGLSPELVEEVTPSLVDMFYKNWTPCSENIELLPEPIRKFIHDIDGAQEKYSKLYHAIEKHKNQRGDDRCWLDDAELYAAAGLQDANTALPGKEEFLTRCAIFHATRQNPKDKYITVEQRIEEALATSDKLNQLLLDDKNKLLSKLEKQIKRTLSDLRMAIERQRKIGGREAGTIVSKYVIPAAKRLGWKPTKEKARGKRKG